MARMKELHPTRTVPCVTRVVLQKYSTMMATKKDHMLAAIVWNLVYNLLTLLDNTSSLRRK